VPFTLSHVAAILPVRRWLPPSALAVGAVVPDLPYYLPLPFSSASTHAWWGLLLGVPSGAVLLVLFHQVLRAPLVALAPAGVRTRLPVAPRPAPVAVVVAALVAGMATHLVWDGFTQVGGFAVAHWQVLRLPVIGPHRVFNVLMYASSAGGLAALAGWFALWYRRTPVRSERLPGVAGRMRGAVLATVTVAAIAGAAAGAVTDRAAVSGYDLVRSMILRGADGAAVILACYVLAWHAWNVVSTRRAARDAGPPV
jgi:hypothetical protein